MTRSLIRVQLWVFVFLVGLAGVARDAAAQEADRVVWELAAWPDTTVSGPAPSQAASGEDWFYSVTTVSSGNHAPEDFVAVGDYYEDFGPTSDEEVLGCLRRARAEHSADARR